jgi:ParB family chromosome partitioning protein
MGESMNNNFSFKLDIEDRLKKASSELGSLSIQNETAIKKINTDDILNWEYRDRKDFELGDIDHLAESIKNNGQAQPIVLVEYSDIFKSDNGDKSKYIVIAGYRRWLACKKNKCDVEAVIKDLSFEQAVSCLVSENEKEGISDYSKGVFYNSLLSSGNVKKIDLYTKLGLSKSAFNNYLAFTEIPDELIESIDDLSKVSSRTAYEIKRLSLKGRKYIDVLVKISPQIRNGAGEKTINSLINKHLSSKSGKLRPFKYSHNGTLAFTSSGNKIVFSKAILSSPKYEEIMRSIQQLSNEILDNEADDE